MKKIVLFLIIISSAVLYSASYTGLITELVVPPFIAGSGGAGTAYSGTVNSLYLNPAGAAAVNNNEIMVFYKNYYKDLFISSLAGVYPLDSSGVVGGKFSYFGMPSDGSVVFSEFMGTISYAYKILDLVSAGLNVNIVNSKLAQYTATAFTVDFGAVYTIDIPKTLHENILSLGVFVKNLGTGLKYLEVSEPFEKIAEFGILYQYDRRYSFLYDAELKSEKIISHIGAEYRIHRSLQLRAGWNNDEDHSKLFFGTSVSVNVQGFQLGLDYTFNPMNNLGVPNHNISVSIKF